MIVKGRIEPFNDEDISRIPPAHYIKPTWNLKDALNMIAECRSLVEGVERDVARIDGLIKGIENDAISREEMKPYLGKNRTD